MQADATYAITPGARRTFQEAPAIPVEPALLTMPVPLAIEARDFDHAAVFNSLDDKQSANHHASTSIELCLFSLNKSDPQCYLVVAWTMRGPLLTVELFGALLKCSPGVIPRVLGIDFLTHSHICM